MKLFVLSWVLNLITGITFAINIGGLLFIGGEVISWYIPIGLSLITLVLIAINISKSKSDN